DFERNVFFVVSASDNSFLLTSLSFGVTPSFFTSAEACAMTALWSLIIVSANLMISAFFDFSLAMSAYAMSIWLATTATDATSASESFGASCANEAVTHSRLDNRIPLQNVSGFFMMNSFE